jgi:signal transduction histidine kinase
MKSRSEIEYKILKIIYIITILIIFIPFAGHIYFDLHNELHTPFSDLGDLLGVFGEAVVIFLLGFFGARAIRKLMRENREMEGRHQSEKEEMNKKFIENVMSAQERERKKVSRELHDGIGQQLSVVKMNLEMIDQRKGRKAFSEDINGAVILVNESIQELKKLSTDVRPSILDDLGLVSALKGYIEKCRRSTGISIIFNENINGGRLPTSVETNIYRVAQEAISNALKHSKADTLKITMRNENSELFFSIEDNGKGFEPEKYLKPRVDDNCLGIISMQERVALMDGDFHIKSEIGKGTIIEIRIPVKESI